MTWPSSLFWFVFSFTRNQPLRATEMCLDNLIISRLFSLPLFLVWRQIPISLVLQNMTDFSKEGDLPVSVVLRNKRATWPPCWGNSASFWWLVPWSSWKSFTFSTFFFPPESSSSAVTGVKGSRNFSLTPQSQIHRLQKGFWPTNKGKASHLGVPRTG